jgi:hypothetical protein
MEMPAEVEQVIHVLTAHATLPGEQLIDHLQGAAPAALRGSTIGQGGRGAESVIHSGQESDYFRQLLSIQTVFS